MGNPAVYFGIEHKVGHEWEPYILRTRIESANQALEIANSYNATSPGYFRAVRCVTTTEVITKPEECEHCFCLLTMPPKCCKCGEFATLPGQRS